MSKKDKTVNKKAPRKFLQLLKTNRLLLGALVVVGLCAILAYAQTDLERVAVDTVSRQTSIPADYLLVESSARLDFPMQGTSTSSFKVTDTRTGDIYAITLDDSGSVVDEEGLETAEREAYIAQYGKVEFELAQILERANPTDLIEVVFWLNSNREVSLMRPEANTEISDEEVDNIFSSLDAERAEIAKQSNAAFITTLESYGIVAEADELTPTVSASVPASLLRGLSNSDEVDLVYLQGAYESNLASARPTIRANVVNDAGNIGQGVRVAQVEVGGILNNDNPFLAGIVQDTRHGCYNNHGTNVAGVIRSTHPFVRGIAPGVQLWAGGSCNGRDAQLKDRSNAAANWGARAINLSLGRDTGLSLTSFDRFYDNMVQDGWRTISVSAGNNNPPFGSGTGNVGSPGLAYNVITVGSFDHNGDDFWGNDGMSAFTSWRDPRSAHGDREKPEVAAPGCVQTTSFTNLGFHCGTSFAAPMVTGATALLINTNRSLSVWPEAVKSIFMATAVHNIEGDARLSEVDGAGGIEVDRANRVAGNTDGGWGARNYTCRASRNTNVSTQQLAAGSRVRVAMAWDTNPTFWNLTYGRRPSADLDMQIIAPNGAVVARSASWDNTYEIVDFVAPMNGVYTLRVVKYRCNHDPKWLGWAWHVVNPGIVNLALTATATASSTYPWEGYAPARVNDGSRSTALGGADSWVNADRYAANGFLPQWVQLDFGANRTFSRVDIYTTTGFQIQDYRVQFWDGTAWIDVGGMPVVGNTALSRRHDFPSVTSRFVRVLGTQGPVNQPQYVRVNEFEVYQ